MLAFFFTSCAALDKALKMTSPKKMNHLNIGMTKQEVISVLGSPDSTAAPGNGVEFLRYTLDPWNGFWDPSATEAYFVRLVDGRVDSYGRVGDFDSTKDPTLNLNIKNR